MTSVPWRNRYSCAGISNYKEALADMHSGQSNSDRGRDGESKLEMLRVFYAYHFPSLFDPASLRDPQIAR